MKIFQQYSLATVAFLLVAASYSCQQAGGEKTGSEFIPDMAHSVAYEANVSSKYDLNSWDETSVKSYRELTQPRLPVNGTVPRGYAGIGANDGIFTTAADAVAYTLANGEIGSGAGGTPNGSVPYYYPDTEEGRLLATQQIRFNPFPITQDGINRGQELYNIFCGICHGEKGVGDGNLYEGPNAKYPAKPANIGTDSLIVFSNNGRYYHAIMYGKNAMGGYADKLSYEERWQVIHYIRLLQAEAKKLKYDSEANTFNPAFGVPMALAKTAPAVPPSSAPDAGKQPAGEATHGATEHTHTEGDADGGH